MVSRSADFESGGGEVETIPRTNRSVSLKQGNRFLSDPGRCKVVGVHRFLVGRRAIRHADFTTQLAGAPCVHGFVGNKA